MGKLLMLILGWFTQHLIVTLFKYIFSGLIGLASYQFIQILINKYITAAISELYALGTLQAMINISRFDVAISIIMGAYAIRGSIIALGLVVIKPE